MVRTIWSVGLIAVVPLCVMAVILSSCATPKLPLPALVAGDASDALPPEALSEALQGSWARQARVSGLAYPLRLRNAELCGADTAKDLGIEWITLDDLPKTNPRVAGTMLGVERLPFVAVVTPGSPADQGGIRQGDSLLSVNGRPLPAAAEEYNAYVTVNTVTVPWYRRRVDGMLAEAVGSGSPAEVAIRRGGEELNLFVRTVDACDYNVLAVEDPDLGIAGHGKSVLVSTGLLDFAQSEAEVQAAFAHQFAHAMEKHGAREARNSVIGGPSAARPHSPWWGRRCLLLACFPGTRAVLEGAVEGVGAIAGGSAGLFGGLGAGLHAVSREKEADYVALYVLERAGIDADEAVRFWSRIPADAPLAIAHAGKEERLKNMEATVQEIKRKINAREPLLPNENRKPVIGGD